MSKFKNLQKETYQAQKIQIDNYIKKGGFVLGPWMTNFIHSDPTSVIHPKI